MCEVEATLSLRERYEMMKPPSEPVDENCEQSRELVLLSRKRQERIRHCLESHKAKAHSA
jgi:hypothetical protein